MSRKKKLTRGAESLVEALNLVKMRNDTQATPLGVPTLVEQAKFVDAVVEDTVEKALKYTQVDERVNA